MSSLSKRRVGAALAASAAGVMAMSAMTGTAAQAADDFKVIELSDEVVALPEAPEEGRIVGGTPARQGAYPWMAKLSIKTPRGTGACGGTFISPDIILSAQHCVEGKVEGITAYYGDVNWRDGNRVVVDRVIAGGGVKKGDWAILKLKNRVNVKTITPAQNTNFNNGPTFRSIGWGRTKQGGSTSSILRQVDLPFISDRVCGTGTNEICAGDYDNGGIDTCQGDSGGPLFHLNRGNPVQVGIVSWGIGCAKPKNPGHYTEVSTYWSSMSSAITRLGGTQPGGTPGGGGDGGDGGGDGGGSNPVPGSYTNNERHTIRNYRSVTSSVYSKTSSANKLGLDVRIEHRCANHLRLDIQAPNGRWYNLQRGQYASGSQCVNWTGTTSGEWDVSLSTNGKWSLKVTDEYGGASGTINGWTLRFR